MPSSFKFSIDARITALMEALQGIDPPCPPDTANSPQEDAEWGVLPSEGRPFWRIRGCNHKLTDLEIDAVFRNKFLNPTDSYVSHANRSFLRKRMRQYGEILQQLTFMAEQTANLEATQAALSGDLIRLAPGAEHQGGILTKVLAMDGVMYQATPVHTPLAMSVLEVRDFVRQQYVFDIVQCFSCMVPTDEPLLLDDIRNHVRDAVLEMQKGG